MNEQDFQHGWNLANSATAEKAAHMQSLIAQLEALKTEQALLLQRIAAAEADTAAHNVFVVAFREAALEAGVNPKLLQVV